MKIDGIGSGAVSKVRCQGLDCAKPIGILDSWVSRCPTYARDDFFFVNFLLLLMGILL